MSAPVEQVRAADLLARLRRHYIKPGAIPGGIFLTEVGLNGSFGASSRSVAYPKSYTGSPFPFVAVSGDAAICDTCSFRPWASIGQLMARGDIVVLNGGAVKAVRSASCQSATGISCTADVSGLATGSGDQLQARIYDQDGNYEYAAVAP